MSYLKTIQRLSAADNLGGLLVLYVARKSEIVSIPDPVYGIIPGDIEFVAGAGFTQWDVTTESLRKKSNDRTSREGSSKGVKITFVVPKNRPEIKAIFDLAEEDEFIVLEQDSNGTLSLSGLIEAPLRFRYSHDSGEKFADGNFYECEFYYDGPDNSNFYSGAITLPTASVGTSTVKFTSGELIALLSPSDQLIVSSNFEHTFTLVPGFAGAGAPALVKWDTGELIASLQPGDTLLVDTAFSFDFEIIETI